MSRSFKLFAAVIIITAIAVPAAGCGSGASPSDSLAPTLTQPIDRAHDAANQVNQAQKDLQNSADQITP